MKRPITLLAAALALPAIAAEPDPNPNRLQSDSIDKPVLEAPRHPSAAEPRADTRTARRERRDGEPPAGAEPVSEAELELLRIRARSPRYGREIDDRVLPAERAVHGDGQVVHMAGGRDAIVGKADVHLAATVDVDLRLVGSRHVHDALNERSRVLAPQNGVGAHLARPVLMTVCRRNRLGTHQ